MNLWAEFDNQHAQEEAVGPKQTRRLTEQVVLSSLRTWLLEDYASSYCHVLAAMRIYRHCYWIDAWGSNARSDNRATNTKSGSQTDDTPVLSPVLQPLASLSTALAQASKPIAFHGIVLGSGSSRRKERKAEQKGTMDAMDDRVEEATATPVKETLTLPKENGIIHSSWLEIAPPLLSEIASSPAIFLLNPFGQTLFTNEDLLPLYQRKAAPTELCFLVPHQQAELRLLSLSRTPAGAAALTTLLRTDRWKTFLSGDAGDEGTTHRLDGILDLFMASMQQHFLWVQHIAFPLQVRPAVIELMPYSLLFATRSKDSLTSMNDAVCLYRRRLTLQSRRGLLGEEWFVAQQQERLAEELQQLRQHILRQGRAQRVRRWPDIRQQLLPGYFGQFTLRDYDEVICSLLEQGDVRCEWKHLPPGDKHQRVPGNEDTLLWKPG